MSDGNGRPRAASRVARWLRWAWRLALAALALALLLHPELQGLAPILDLVGAIGLDGLLLMLEVQCILWLLLVFRRHLASFLTRLWNRHGAPRLGLSPSADAPAEAVLDLLHVLLCRGGKAGLAVYLLAIALYCHYAPHLALPPA